MPDGAHANTDAHAERVHVYGAPVVGVVIVVDGYEARVKLIGERDDGIVHARIRRPGINNDEIAHRDPATGLWRLGRAKISS